MGSNLEPSTLRISNTRDGRWTFTVRTDGRDSSQEQEGAGAKLAHDRKYKRPRARGHGCPRKTCHQDSKAERAAARRRTPPGLRFAAGDLVLVLKGRATSMIKKWPIDKSKLYGPCRVVNARHPRYNLAFAKVRFSRRAIHARRLVPFIQNHAHLM